MNDSDEFLKDLANMPEKIKESHIPISISDGVDEMDNVDDLEVSETTSAEDEILGESENSLVEVRHHDILPKDELDKMVDTRDAEKTEGFILESCRKIVEQGFDTLSNLQDTVISTADGKTIAGYANLIGSIGKVLDTANAVSTNKQRMAHQAKMEKLKADLKKQIAKEAPQQTKNTFNIVAGREEIMKMLSEA